MQVVFWGVRGSIPCPGQKTVKYGGNTACLELRVDGRGRHIIIDAGSGIRELGNVLMAGKSNGRALDADLFLTHTHTDHILGFPFFTPLYSADTRLTIYGPVPLTNDSLETVLGGQLAYQYFPVRLDELSAHITYVDLKECHFLIGDDIRVSTIYLNHSLSCIGYRFVQGNKIFCTAYDTEPYRNYFGDVRDDSIYDAAMDHQGAQAAAECNRRLEDFFHGADLLVYDAQYTQKEYEAAKVGWGHSAMETAIATAKRANVKRLALFHHDPARSDDQLDALSALLARPKADKMEIFFAREGQRVVF